MYNHFPFMAPSNTTQDDYYTQVQSAQKSSADDKKPLKIKIKPPIKKSADNGHESVSDVIPEVILGQDA